jgi:hypothetical protein
MLLAENIELRYYTVSSSLRFYPAVLVKVSGGLPGRLRTYGLYYPHPALNSPSFYVCTYAPL